jgi:MYXO-CTERM domain-containing protein
MLRESLFRFIRRDKIMKKTFAIVAIAGLAAVANADILAGWTFETSVPTTAGPHAAEVGSGAATGVHASGATVWSNPVGNRSGESFSTNKWGSGDYYQFTVDTSGYTNIAFAWSQTRSGTGPGAFDLAVSTDGVNFTTLSSYLVDVITWSFSTPQPGSDFGPVSAPSAADAGLVTFRLIATGAASGSGGTNRVDDIYVTGDVIPAPGAVALIGLGGLFAGRRRR